MNTDEEDSSDKSIPESAISPRTIKTRQECNKSITSAHSSEHDKQDDSLPKTLKSKQINSNTNNFNSEFEILDDTPSPIKNIDLSVITEVCDKYLVFLTSLMYKVFCFN